MKRIVWLAVLLGSCVAHRAPLRADADEGVFDGKTIRTALVVTASESGVQIDKQMSLATSINVVAVRTCNSVSPVRFIVVDFEQVPAPALVEVPVNGSLRLPLSAPLFDTDKGLDCVEVDLQLRYQHKQKDIQIPLTVRGRRPR